MAKRSTISSAAKHLFTYLCCFELRHYRKCDNKVAINNGIVSFIHGFSNLTKYITYVDFVRLITHNETDNRLSRMPQRLSQVSVSTAASTVWAWQYADSLITGSCTALRIFIPCTLTLRDFYSNYWFTAK